MINYCDSYGNCSKCGNCCAALIPITRKEEKRIRDYIKENNIQPEYFQDDENINLQCCFYDRKNKKCKIYEARPKICRSFRCNRNESELEKEKIENHKRAYWNNITNDIESHLTDMRLLFYDDPRSLIANIIYKLTDGTMKCNERQFEIIKEYLKRTGQRELANHIRGVFKDESKETN